MQTKVLYYDDINLLDFEANILDIREDKGRYQVILDQTAFYPEGGGMNCDIGLIDNIEVIHVEKKDDEILHILKDKPNNNKVECHVDPYIRKTNIQIHDAQHLLSAIFEKDYGLITVSHHVHDNYCDLAFEGNELTPEIVKAVEKKANQFIFDNHELTTKMIAKKDLAKFGIKDNPKYSDPVRITNIEGLDDNNACGCLHFSSVGPIQAIKCLSIEKSGKQSKILFSAGLRMLTLFNEYNNIIKELKVITKGNEETLIQKVDDIIDKNNTLTKELNESKEQYYSVKLDTMINNDTIVFEGPDNNFDELKIVANIVVNSSKDIHGLLQMKKDDKYQFILVKQKDSNYSLEDLFSKLKADFNLQGGGKGLMINGQSTIDLTKEIEKYL